MMVVTVNNPASCDVRSDIQFLNAICHNVSEIHRDLCNEPTVMSEGKVRQCCCNFNDSHTNVHVEENSRRPNIQTDNIIKQVGPKV